MTGTSHKNAVGKRHKRRSIRLKGYDYTLPGADFVTVCAYRRAQLFGDIVNGEMNLNRLGKIVEAEWLRTSQIRPYVQLDEYVIMPNHVHGIVMITDAHRGVLRYASTTTDSQTRLRSPSLGLGAIIRGFKSAATKRVNEYRRTPGQPVWQRNYFEHIIRNDGSLNQIREYIHYNPQRWHLDKYNLPPGLGA